MRLRKLAFVCVSLAALLSCSLPGSDPQGAASVRLSLVLPQSRTVLPSAWATSSSYTLQITGANSVIKNGLTSTETTIDGLSTGECQLTVSALNASGVTLYRGIWNGTLATGLTTVSLTLLPLQEGTGRIDWSFTCSGTVSALGSSPAVVLRKSLDATQPPYGTNLDTTPVDLTDLKTVTKAASKLSIALKGNLPSGTYLLTVTLSSASGVDYAPWTTVVQIYDTETSTGSISVDQADLTAAPGAPSDLKVAGYFPESVYDDGTGNEFRIAWSSNEPYTESGFKIYVDGTYLKTVTDSYTELSVPVDGAVITVTAYNSYGESAAASLTYVAITSFSVEIPDLILSTSGTANLPVTVFPSNATLASFVYWVDNTNALGISFSTYSDGKQYLSKFNTGADSLTGHLPVGTTSPADSTVSLTAYGVSTGLSGGNGTSASPYIVSSMGDLVRMGGFINSGYGRQANYRQTADIDLSGLSWVAIGADTTYAFRGAYSALDGATQHTISNLSCYDSSNQGLFGVTSGATLDHIVLTGVSLNLSSSVSNIGALAGRVLGGTVSHCSAAGSVLCSAGSSSIGGLIGQAEAGAVIEKSYFSGSVTGDTDVGGLIGLMTSGAQVNNSYVSGSITATSYTDGPGGIVGLMTKSEEASPSMSYCYAACTYFAPVSIGGLVGVIGSGADVLITSSYWESADSGVANAVGSGSAASGSSTAGATTTALQTKATYAGWDFTSIWSIFDGSGYPILR